MVSREKLAQAMRSNPRGDWSISDVKRLCAIYGIVVRSPGGGSHYVLSHPGQRHLLTVPARRPIKPVYIRKLLAFIDGLDGETDS